MKLFILFLLLIGTIHANKKCLVIKAKAAKNYMGKEVIIREKLLRFSNSSYGQFSTLELGQDSAHIVLSVMIQGEFYRNYASKTPIKTFIGKIIDVKGMVEKNDRVYLNATDTLKLAPKKCR